MVHHFPGFDRSNADTVSRAVARLQLSKPSSGDHALIGSIVIGLGVPTARASTAVDHWPEGLILIMSRDRCFCLVSSLVWPGRDFAATQPRELVAPQIFRDSNEIGGASAGRGVLGDVGVLCSFGRS